MTQRALPSSANNTERCHHGPADRSQRQVGNRSADHEQAKPETGRHTFAHTNTRTRAHIQKHTRARRLSVTPGERKPICLPEMNPRAAGEERSVGIGTGERTRTAREAWGNLRHGSVLQEGGGGAVAAEGSVYGRVGGHSLPLSIRQVDRG